MRAWITLVVVLSASPVLAQSQFPGTLPRNCNNGQVPVYNTSTNVWDCGSGGGGGTIGGTIALNQIAVGDGADSIDGSAGLTWNGSTLVVGGDITASTVTLSGDMIIGGSMQVDNEPQDVLKNEAGDTVLLVDADGFPKLRTGSGDIGYYGFHTSAGAFISNEDSNQGVAFNGSALFGWNDNDERDITLVLGTDDDNSDVEVSAPLRAVSDGHHANISTEFADPNANLSFSATAFGQDGNVLAVHYIDPGGNNEPLTFTANGNTLEISLATDGMGVITTTAQDIIDNFDADGLGIGSPAPVGDSTGVVEAVGPLTFNGGLSGLNVSAASWLDSGAITTDGGGILTGVSLHGGSLQAGDGATGNVIVVSGSDSMGAPALTAVSDVDMNVSFDIIAQGAGTINLNSPVVNTVDMAGDNLVLSVVNSSTMASSGATIQAVTSDDTATGTAELFLIVHQGGMDTAAFSITVPGDAGDDPDVTFAFPGNAILDDTGHRTIINSLKTTGAAATKKVVCVDTTTGQLFASSSDTVCAN